ncbi:MAG: CvpA family protein, partial [Chloroflexota bacterium]
MNGIDIVILGLWLLGLLFGLMKGALGLVLPLFGLAVGLGLANKYASTLAQSLFDTSATVARVGSFALIVFAVLVTVAIVVWLLRRLLSMLLLGWIDRVAGAVLGLSLSVVTTNLFLSIMAMAAFGPVENYLQGSTLASLLAQHFPS